MCICVALSGDSLTLPRLFEYPLKGWLLRYFIIAFHSGFLFSIYHDDDVIIRHYIIWSFRNLKMHKCIWLVSEYRDVYTVITVMSSSAQVLGGNGTCYSSGGHHTSITHTHVIVDSNHQASKQ